MRNALFLICLFGAIAFFSWPHFQADPKQAPRHLPPEPLVQRSVPAEARAVKVDRPRERDPLKEFEWEVVGSVAAVQNVFVEPEGLADHDFLSHLLRKLTTRDLPPVSRRTGVCWIKFFDVRRATPKNTSDFTIEQAPHWKAQYNRNPNTGHEEFRWVTVRGDDDPEYQRILAELRAFDERIRPHVTPEEFAEAQRQTEFTARADIQFEPADIRPAG